MSEDTLSPPPALCLDQAVHVGLNEVTRTKTLELYARKYGQPDASAPLLLFRGDVAEAHQYDKIRPLSAARALGNVIVIEAQSQKLGTTGHYQIQCNQWNLLEVLAKLA
ncbi:hypothetical protein [Pantoea sp. 18069]|uniref:hypothetical protein n=1 Tax=Pantoea sp. 18069 TaxID=2681415 RepID=UPI00135CB1F2|nr:hypothetical protein [Pantoea sp. 18069]